jgi:glycosyltransferase involved in cell wall biosynthesis
MRKLITSLEMPASRIFVNASIDTLFEAHHATNRRIATGYNVLGNEASSTLFNMLDHLAVRTSVGKIVAHTHYQKNLYMKMGIEKNNVRVIPHCIDLKRIEKSAEDRNTELDAAETTGPIIFYGGRLSVDKGIKELLRCYHQISKEYSATLVLVGDGPLKGWILQKKKEIESETQDSSIVFLGAWQPPEVLLSIMRKSDIVVLPSYHEMCPIILLEAMCLRKAIVSTRFGGPQEIITNGENGIYINPHDESELKTALVKLIIDSRLRTRLGTNAFRTLMERYEVSVVAPEFIRFLEGD